MLALGWAFKRYGFAGEGAEKVFNRYLFYIALPALTIVKISDTTFTGLGFDFIILNFLPLAVLMGFIYLGWKAGVLDTGFARLLIITAGLGNTVYLGFPVVAMSLGAENLGYAAIVASLQNLFIFTFGFLLMNLVCAENCPAAGFRRLVLKNAILWSSLAGLVISGAGIKIPGIIHDILNDLGRTALPLSLVTIGMSLYGKRLTHESSKMTLIICLKMLLLPAVYLGLALLFGFKGMLSKIIFIQFAMPAAVLNFVIAKEFEFDSELVSQTIVFSTLLLLPLLFLIDWLMKTWL